MKTSKLFIIFGRENLWLYIYTYNMIWKHLFPPILYIVFMVISLFLQKENFFPSVQKKSF